MTSKVEMGGMMNGVFPVANAQKGGQDAQDVFQGIILNMTVDTQMTPAGQNFQSEKTTAAKETAAMKEPAGQPARAAESSVSNERPADTVKDTAGSRQKTETADSEAAVAEAEEEILSQTAEKLGITVEELEEVLAQMGLAVWDLLEPENVSALVVKVMGDGDMLSLVTDENLSQTVLDLNAAMKEIGAELAEELGIDESDVKAALDSLQGKMQDTEEPIMPQQKTEGAAQIAEEAPVVKERTVAADESNGAEVQNTDAPLAVDAVAEESKSQSSDAQAGQRGFRQDRGEDASSRHSAVREDLTGGLQQIAADTPIIQDAALEAARELMGSSPAEIINQINAYIRQNAAARITEWQMQLNPEHLGTVGLNVTAKEGAVTAQFTTQNEAVKAVMEAQVMVLKENLEQQGIKVEAVEVTVASHEFEQNLQQGDDSNRQMEEEQEQLRKATRKIDLGEFASSEEADEIDEAEQVTVEMMRADGNRMDYKV